MIKKISSILLVLVCLFSGGIFLFSANAENEKSNSSLMSISHRGDTAEFEGNTIEAVVSAFNKGADFVSVNIRKTSDGEFVLCGENKDEVSGDRLADVIDSAGQDNILILDFDSAIKDELYLYIESGDNLSSVIFRINDSAKNIKAWIKDKNENIQVMGIYDSFVVFTAAEYIKSLGESGMAFVQYQSKNYFNEMFGSFVSKAIFASSAKAVVPTYNPDLCGQRRDSEDGWNELIKTGFSVIETNNIESFTGYIESNKNARRDLEKICSKALAIDAEKYNSVSKEKLADAITNAQELLSREVVSTDELQSAASTVALAIENLALKTGEDTQKGALNITPGKVIATVIVGFAIFAAQIYTYKMQKGKKQTGEK